VPNILWSGHVSAGVVFAVTVGVAVRLAAGGGSRAARSRRGGQVARGAGGVLGQRLTLVPADRLGVRLGVFFRQDGGG
jgi:hypothetical protein